MSSDELRQSRQTPWLPQSVESRIAGDAERTQRIIRAYHEHIGPDWPALVFATSVEHSQTVAALLTRDGIRARAVSANTEASVRRRIVEEFRAGEIDALVNYGIFREGFDAPRTRAIVVARPVYSPNLYFQMIGRGLRGVQERRQRQVPHPQRERQHRQLPAQSCVFGAGLAVGLTNPSLAR